MVLGKAPGRPHKVLLLGPVHLIGSSSVEKDSRATSQASKIACCGWLAMSAMSAGQGKGSLHARYFSSLGQLHVDSGVLPPVQIWEV